MLQFGLRAHDFGRGTADSVAASIAPYRVPTIQLALSKALPGEPTATGMLSPGYARRISNAFFKHGISIAVLGCYINPVHPDAGARSAALARFEEHLRFARDFGCAVVGTETGSCNTDCSFHPETASEKTFGILIASLERLVRTAESYGTIVGVEAVAGQHTIDSIARMSRLLATIDSPNLQVIYDPVNLLPIHGLEEPDGSLLDVTSDHTQQRFFDQAFQAFGDRIVAVHLKDFRYRHGLKQGDLCPLSGDLDTAALIKTIVRHKPYIDVLLENSAPSLTAAVLERLRAMARSRQSDSSS